MALAGPSCFWKVVASLGILQRGSLLPQIPVSYCLSLCSGGNRRLYRKAALASSSKLAPHTGVHTLLWEEGGLLGLRALPWPPRLHSWMLTSIPPHWKMWWGCFCPSGYFHAAFIIVRKVVILTSDITLRNCPKPSLFQVSVLAIQKTAHAGGVFLSLWWLGIVSYLSKWGVDLTFCNLVLPIMSFNSITILIW